MKEMKVTFWLSDEESATLDELTRLYNNHMVSEGRCPGYTQYSYLELLLRFRLGELLSDEFAYQQGRLNRNAKEGDISARNPSPDEEPETLSNAEDVTKKGLVDFTFSVTEGNMIHNALCDVGQRALARRFPHTWLFPVEDESLYNAVWEGDTPMTLTPDECKTISDALYARGCSQSDAGYLTIGNEHFDLAQRIAFRLDEEPETLITVRDASGVVREVTLDEAEAMREAAQGIYAGEPPEPDFEPDAPEEEPEMVSNAEEEFPVVRRGPLMDDKSDFYFYYLEHGHWPPDDEVLAGADVPCTGDYGLSDCLVVTQSTLDFVDAFFT